MYLRFCARSVSVLAASILLSACDTAKFRLQSAYGDVSVFRDSVRRPFPTGTALYPGDRIETGEGGAVISIGGCESFEVYPRSTTVLREKPSSCAEHWLRQLRNMLTSFGEAWHSQQGRVPVISVRG